MRSYVLRMSEGEGKKAGKGPMWYDEKRSGQEAMEWRLL